MDISDGQDLPTIATGLISRHSTLTERLEAQKSDLTQRLLEVDTALIALKANPELQNLFDLVSRVRGGY